MASRNAAVFFFFQAEDGIRDLYVTGVQTCALPICQGCGASYHERYKRPQVEGVCDVCGSTDLVHRADDRPETVATRLAAYRNQTAPILPYYRDRGILRSIDGMAEIDEVTREIEAVIADREPGSARPAGIGRGQR